MFKTEHVQKQTLSSYPMILFQVFPESDENQILSQLGQLKSVCFFCWHVFTMSVSRLASIHAQEDWQSFFPPPFILIL